MTSSSLVVYLSDSLQVFSILLDNHLLKSEDDLK